MLVQFGPKQLIKSYYTTVLNSSSEGGGGSSATTTSAVRRLSDRHNRGEVPASAPVPVSVQEHPQLRNELRDAFRELETSEKCLRQVRGEGGAGAGAGAAGNAQEE